MLHAPSFRALTQLGDNRSRNVMRAILSKRRKGPLPHNDAVDHLRNTVRGLDLQMSTQILLGKDGAFPLLRKSLSYSDLQRMHSLSDLPPDEETLFIVGIVNGWPLECKDICFDICSLNAIHNLPPLDQLARLQEFYDRWGVSDFLNKKIVYYMNLAKIDSEVVHRYREFTERLGTKQAPEPYFSSMELLSERYLYVEAVRKWSSILSKYKTNDFRQHTALHMALPVPLSQDDVGSFMRRAYSTSMVDIIISLKVVYSLGNHWPSIADRITTNLHPALLADFPKIDGSLPSENIILHEVEPQEADFVLFRRSAAFIENAALAAYRFDVDSAIGWRMLPKRYGLRFTKPFRLGSATETRSQLVDPPTGFVSLANLSKGANHGTFIRTIEFLSYIAQHSADMNFSEDEIKIIFENTTALQYLLIPEELERLYLTAGSDGRLVVSSLALALYKERDDDEDIDFKFRFSIQQAIISRFERRIEAFVKWLSADFPSIARYITNTLDRTTLQKLYMLIETAEQADEVRQNILRHMGGVLNNISYLVEADRIKAHSQIAKLRMHIDDSRIYVDSISFKRWFREHPNPYLDEYKRFVSDSDGSSAGVSLLIRLVDDPSSSEAIIAIFKPFDYMLVRAMEPIFKEFCLNALFGIDSYLGRRVRHNTLHGMMLGGVDSLIQDYGVLISDPGYMNLYDTWLDAYKSNIDEIRIKFLQFKSKEKPDGLFSSEFDIAAISPRLIADLRNGVLFSPTPEDVEDTIVKFCWDYFEPQLSAAQRFISSILRSQASEKIAAILGGFGGLGDTEAKQFFGRLTGSVHDRFARLSSWFQVPEDRTVSATTREIGDLITVECEQTLNKQLAPIAWSGVGVDVSIRGSSVHRLYDCLFVLAHNAFRDGSDQSPIEVEASLEQGGRTLTMSVTSAFRSPTERDSQVRRVHEILAQAGDLSAAMGREGYSGIRKLLYLTSEGRDEHRVNMSATDEKIRIGFTINVETEEVRVETSPG